MGSAIPLSKQEDGLKVVGKIIASFNCELCLCMQISLSENAGNH